MNPNAGASPDASVDASMTSPRDAYTLGYAPQAAHFVLPYLRAGMHVLDCGCGPGSITRGLARIVAPGEVIGVDVEPRQLAVARAQAEEHDDGNVRFEEASADALPFPAATFDAVFAHAVLAHLRDPAAALREFRRVLKPTGIAGISDLDWGTVLWEPVTPLLAETQALLLRVRAHHSSPFYARQQRRFLQEAGFARSAASTSPTYQTWAGTAPETRGWATTVARWLGELRFVETAIGQGWADQATLDAMIGEVRAWGERPDAFFGVLTCSAIGWVDAVDTVRED
jgi:ubiquinone/menaquinone biosynthesis C-methylase UbiE